MPSAQIIWSQLTEDSTSSIVGYIRLDPDMIFWVKVVEDWSFDECLSQFSEDLPSSGYEKARLRLFGLKRFLNFRLNLIISNLIAIKPPFVIQLGFATSSPATTNPDSAVTRSCLRLNIPWSLQYRGKWCSNPTESLDESSIKIRKSEEHFNVSYWLRLRPLLDSLNSFVLYTDAFWGYHIAKEPNLFLMKLTLSQVGKQQEFPELFLYPLYGWDVSISIIISVDQNVIQIYNDKDVKLLGKDLVDVSLEACWCVC